MATITVDTNVANGAADYHTLAAAIAVVDNAELGENTEIVCYASTSVDDTTRFSLAEIDTTVDYRLTIRPGDSNYRLYLNVSGAGNPGITTESGGYGHYFNVTLDGLTIVSHSHDTSYRVTLYLTEFRWGDFIVKNCDIRSETTTNRDSLIAVSLDGQYDETVTLVNNFLVSGSTANNAASRIIICTVSPPLTLYNNTFVCGHAAQRAVYIATDGYQANVVAKNNVIYSGSAPTYSPATADYNMFSGAYTWGGANDEQGRSFSFVGGTPYDYHLLAFDVGARCKGTDLSADGLFPFNYDIDGNLRITWDAGADEATRIGAYFDGTSYITGTYEDATPFPVTLAGWVRHVDVTKSLSAISWADKDSIDDWFNMLITSNVSTAPRSGVNAQRRAGGFGNIVTGDDVISADTWYHIVIVWTSATAGQAWLNGSSIGTTAVNVTPLALDRISVGRLGDSTPGDPAESWLSDMAMWNFALDTDDVAALLAGASPATIEAGSLICHFPFDTDAEDTVGSISFSITGTINTFADPDAPTGGTAYYGSIGDSVGIGDNITVLGSFIRPITEAVGMVDITSRISTFIRSMGEALGITDILSTGGILITTIEDNENISDDLSKTGVFIRNIQDPLGIIDTIEAVSAIRGQIADPVGITDDLSEVVSKVLTVSDPVGITDTLSKVGSFVRSNVETVGLLDIVSRTGTYIRSMSDPVAIADASSAVKLIIAPLSDAVSIIDVLTSIWRKLVTKYGVIKIDTSTRVAQITGTIENIKTTGAVSDINVDISS